MARELLVLLVLQELGLGLALALALAEVSPGRSAGSTSMVAAGRGRSATWPMWGLWRSTWHSSRMPWIALWMLALSSGSRLQKQVSHRWFLIVLRLSHL